LMKCRESQDTRSRCPNCHVPSIKEGQCNRVQCLRCLKYWCYCCDYVADSDQELYRHLLVSGHISTPRPDGN
jgi:hypothetical protein